MDIWRLKTENALIHQLCQFKFPTHLKRSSKMLCYDSNVTSHHTFIPKFSLPLNNLQDFAHLQVGHVNSLCWPTEGCLIWKGLVCFIHLYATDKFFFSPHKILLKSCYCESDLRKLFKNCSLKGYFGGTQNDGSMALLQTLIWMNDRHSNSVETKLCVCSSTLENRKHINLQLEEVERTALGHVSTTTMY